MLKHILILTLIVGVAVANFGSQCNPQKCNELGPKISPPLSPEEMFPDGERLKKYCPDFLALIECVSEEIETCTGQTFAELAASDNETIAGISNIILGTGHLVMDLCDDDSAIHKAYVENIVCIKNALTDDETEYTCITEARAMYGAYKTPLPQSRTGENHAACLVAAHIFACASGEVQRVCGEEARDTMVDIIKRTKFLKYEICSPDDVVDLQTNYIEFLKLETDRRSLFENAFDFRKRK